MRFLRAIALGACTVFAACSLGAPQAEPLPEPTPEDTQEVPQEPAVRETENVTYSGIVKPAGISVYQQGSHRLVLDDGRFILLESDSVDLNGYVEEDVEVFGAIRPTVEEGGMIMRVENIHLLSAESEGVSSTNSGAVVPDTATGTVADTPDETDDEPKDQPIPEKPVTNTGAVEEPDTPVETEEPNEEPVKLTASQESAITAMAAEDYAAERWTQKYCTGHIGFCFPVHKNWWFQSFGNTTSHLWHVEVGNAPIDSIGDGVIVIKLVSGTVASKNATDGQVSVQGSTAIGYRAWQDNSHFEIVADARLQAAVAYITAQLVAFAG
jgi:hypothetical protein